MATNTIKKRNELTDFGLWVKQRTLERQITLTELASMVGTSKGFLSQMLYGITPGVKYRNRIIKELGGQYPGCRGCVS